MYLVNERKPPAQNDTTSAPGRQPAAIAPDGFGIPWVTYTVIGICGAIFGYLNLGKELPSYASVVKSLIPSALDIWDGAYWAFLIAAFVHFAIWHFLFNMWWAKDFGTVLEPTMGRGKYLGFILASAAISSGAQLAMSNQTGIGFSGVVYAMFGYGLAARHVEPRYQRIINKETIKWMLGWLVLCIVLTVLKTWNVANAAHVAGFLFGYFIGNAFVARVYVTLSRVGLACLAVLTVTSAVYMPWSDAWKYRHEIRKLQEIREQLPPQNAAREKETQ